MCQAGDSRRFRIFARQTKLTLCKLTEFGNLKSFSFSYYDLDVDEKLITRRVVREFWLVLPVDVEDVSTILYNFNRRVCTLSINRVIHN